MPYQILEHHSTRPSALRYMSRAFFPSTRRGRGPAHALAMRWADLRIDPREIAAYRASTGLPDEEVVPIVYPHVFGFRLQMALLTHPSFPFPIWNALQIRNRFRRLLPFTARGVFDLEARVIERRALDKGVEIDLRSELRQGGAVVHEGTTTYFYRGRPGAPSGFQPPAAPDLREAPVAARFRTPADGGRRFAEMTGDYNGIHLFDAYARAFGFRRAFLHPQRVASACLARLPERASQGEQRLDLWLKGPVFYGAEAELRARDDSDGLAFAVSLAGDGRPAIVGCLAP